MRSSCRSRAPPRCVSFQTSHESTVPKASPDRGCSSEQPLELRRREVRIGHEPGALADQVARRARGSARPCAGPATRSPARPAGRSRGSRGRRLALVRDRDGLDAVEARAAALRRASTLCQISSGSCSTQPGCGKCWRQLDVATPVDAQLLVDDQARRPRRALVDREDHASRARRTRACAARRRRTPRRTRPACDRRSCAARRRR